MLTSFLCVSCARIIESTSPPASNYRETAVVIEQAVKSSAVSPSVFLASAVDFATLGQGGEVHAPSVRGEYIRMN